MKKQTFLSLLLAVTLAVTSIFMVAQATDATPDAKQAAFLWLDELPVIDSDRYTGNMGDSFIGKIGTRNGTIDTNGYDWEHGLEAWIARWNFMNESSWAWCTYDLAGEYRTLAGTVGLLDASYNKSNFNTTIEILGDDNLLYSAVLTPDMQNMPICVDISAVKTLKIYLYDNSSVAGGTSFALGDLRVLKGQMNATAVPNRSTVLINGEKIAFDAYTIDQNNYFKLRDLAKVLSGTGKQFEVTWDGSNKAINMLSGKPYTAVGGELAPGDGANKTTTINTATIYLDGQPIYLTAYTINQNNYFKLRDVGQAFDFDVTWDGANNTIVVDTDQSYTPD